MSFPAEASFAPSIAVDGNTIETTGSMTVAERATDYFLDVPRLTSHDFEAALDDDEIRAVEEFEIKWYQFLSSNPTVLQPSTKVKRTLVDIPNKITQQQITTKQVEMELQRQLDFFESSKSQLESNFASAMESTALLQNEIQQKLNDDIDNVARADQLLTAELPWEFYFDNLDELIKEAKLGQVSLEGRDEHDSTLPPFPSQRALYLSEIDDQMLLAKAALMQKSSLLLKKAYAIDDALLEAEVITKQKQIQRLEKTIDSQKTLSKFLTEHNIWSMLPKDNKQNNKRSK